MSVSILIKFFIWGKETKVKTFLTVVRKVVSCFLTAVSNAVQQNSDQTCANASRFRVQGGTFRRRRGQQGA